jgi:hypothetical protein
MGIPVVGGLLGRLPAAVFVIAALIIGPHVLQGMGLTPTWATQFVGSSVLWDIQMAVALVPYLAAIAGLTAVVFLVGHHPALAIAAVSVMVILILGDFGWNAGLGAWATGHLGAA